MKKLILFGAIVGLAVAGAANATEFYDAYGVLRSNVCIAPSGAVWVYPMYVAQPVGSYCTIPTTGELGRVGG
jgi:hypothetical protein